MSLSPESLTILCEVEERATWLVGRIEQVRTSIEFAELAKASDIGHVDRVMTFTAQLDRLAGEYMAFNHRLRWLIARLRQSQ